MPAAKTAEQSGKSNGYEETATASTVNEDTPRPPSHPQAADQFEVNEDGDVEPISSGADLDNEEEPAPASAPASPNASPAAGNGGSEQHDSGKSEDLDEFWSNLKSDLQSRHLPSFSLISQFAFPLSIRQDELVIGVLKEHLQKLVEGKAEQIKTSAKIISGRDLFIKVRVSAQDTPPPPKATNTGSSRPNNDGPSGANRGQTQERSSSPDRSAIGNEGDEEPGEPVQAAQASALRANTAGDERRAPAEKSASPKATGDISRPSSADLSRSDYIDSPPTDNQLMVKEAYKLFEGPGSRRVG